MVRSSGAAVLRWVLLCALALGVLGMHHLGTPSPGHHATGMSSTATAMPAAMSSGASEELTPHAGAGEPGMAATECCGTPVLAGWSAPMPAGHHGDLGHLCLAILGTALGVGLLVRLLRRHRPARPAARGPARAGASRPRSPPSTSTVLASLCVLRL